MVGHVSAMSVETRSTENMEDKNELNNQAKQLEEAKHLEEGFGAIMDKMEEQLAIMSVEEITPEMRRNVFKKNLNQVPYKAGIKDKKKKETPEEEEDDSGTDTDSGVAMMPSPVWTLNNFEANVQKAMDELEERKNIIAEAVAQQAIEPVMAVTKKVPEKSKSLVVPKLQIQAATPRSSSISEGQNLPLLKVQAATPRSGSITEEHAKYLESIKEIMDNKGDTNNKNGGHKEIISVDTEAYNDQPAFKTKIVKERENFLKNMCTISDEAEDEISIPRDKHVAFTEDKNIENSIISSQNTTSASQPANNSLDSNYCHQLETTNLSKMENFTPDKKDNDELLSSKFLKDTDFSQEYIFENASQGNLVAESEKRDNIKEKYEFFQEYDRQTQNIPLRKTSAPEVTKNTTYSKNERYEYLKRTIDYSKQLDDDQTTDRIHEDEWKIILEAGDNDRDELNDEEIQINEANREKLKKWREDPNRYSDEAKKNAENTSFGQQMKAILDETLNRMEDDGIIGAGAKQSTEISNNKIKETSGQSIRDPVSHRSNSPDSVRKRRIEKARKEVAAEPNILQDLVQKTELARHHGSQLEDLGDDIDEDTLLDGFMEGYQNETVVSVTQVVSPTAADDTDVMEDLDDDEDTEEENSHDLRRRYLFAAGFILVAAVATWLFNVK